MSMGCPVIKREGERRTREWREEEEKISPVISSHACAFGHHSILSPPQDVGITGDDVLLLQAHERHLDQLNFSQGMNEEGVRINTICICVSLSFSICSQKLVFLCIEQASELSL